MTVHAFPEIWSSASVRVVSDHWMDGRVDDVIRPNLRQKPLEIDGCKYFFQISAFPNNIKVRLNSQTGYSFMNTPKIGVIYPTLSVFGYKLRTDFHNCCVLDIKGTRFDRNGGRELGIFYYAPKTNILTLSRN